MSTPFHLTNKNILITGASSGIGRQCAISCSRMGANVILLGRDEERLEETRSQLSSGTRSHCFSVDLTHFGQVAETIAAIVKELGPLYGLVHSAGISNTLPLRSLQPEKVEHYLRTNVTTAIELCRLATKKANLSPEGASIVLLSSVMAEVGEVGKTAYSLTKGALLAGMRSMALELAPKNVRVNCVSPGVVRSPMSQSAIYSQSEEGRRRVENLHPLGLGEPEDVANACIYLLSDAARWVTGTNLIVDGGYTAR